MTDPWALSLQCAASLYRRRSPSLGRYCHVVGSRPLLTPSNTPVSTCESDLRAASKNCIWREETCFRATDSTTSYHMTLLPCSQFLYIQTFSCVFSHASASSRNTNCAQRGIFKNLTVANGQVIKTFPSVHGRRIFIIVFSRLRHLFLSTARLIQSKLSVLISITCFTLIPFHLGALLLPNDLSPSRLPAKFRTYFLYSDARYMHRPSSTPWFDHSTRS